MYTSFYQLERKPFQISSDPEFMWFGEKHKEALATLKYGILDNKGFLLLTGDVGTGKTTLINSLLGSLDEDVIRTTVPDPGLEKLDFFNFIAAAFGIEEEFGTKGKFLAHFRKFLIQANDQGKKVLLIIDEAQLLTQEMLEEIRLLSNIEKMDTKLINIFFVGQNEFNEILNRDQNRAVRQRLTLNYNIDPLTPDETAEYITHRLKIAGAAQAIFDISATQEVFMYSGGFPRRINVICDHCLLSGYVQEQKLISESIVRECAKELKIPAYVQNRDINGLASYHERKPAPKPVPKSNPEPAPSPPIRQPVVAPPNPKGEVPAREKKSSAFLKGVLFVVIALALAWFLFFPNEFNTAVDIIGQRTTDVRQKIAATIPQPYASVIYKEPSQTWQGPDTQIKKPLPAPVLPVKETHSSPIKEVQNKTQVVSSEEKKKIESSHETIDEIQPIPTNVLDKNKDDELIIEDAVRSQVASKEKTGKQDRDFSMDKSQDTSESVVEISKAPKPSSATIEKQILPLPEQKLIIRFKYNTNDLTPEAYSKLIVYSGILAMHPGTNVQVTGYTDSEGYQQYNRKLSEFRANIVRSFLLGRGIEPEQVKIKGLGSENPIESNTTSWGRMMNRRVEIEVVK